MCLKIIKNAKFEIVLKLLEASFVGKVFMCKKRATADQFNPRDH